MGSAGARRPHPLRIPRPRRGPGRVELADHPQEAGEGYRRLFAGFDAEKVARFTPKRIKKILLDPGIIRNRAKVEATVRNARAYIAVQEEFGSFDTYIWGFVGGAPKVNRWRRIEQLPATTPISEAVSADLRRRDFRFVGPTVCYSHLQAAGLVNDHLVSCFRYAELT